jgi:hypothetical protein
VTSPISTFIAYQLVAGEKMSSGWIMALEILRYSGIAAFPANPADESTE